MEEVWKIEGPVLILAAPGTGKTTTIAKRLKYLINEKKIKPENIFCMTFTQDAKGEMLEKLRDRSDKNTFLEESNIPKHITTMHGLGLEIIKKNREKVNLAPKERIKDIRLIEGEIIDILMLDLCQVLYDERKELLEKKNRTSVNICREKGKCSNNLSSKKCIVCKKYEDLLRKLNTIDYSDQIKLAVKILDDDERLKKVKESVKHLLVDEYQDINGDQFRFIELLSRGNRDGLFVVGDDDQSIYSFRGGSPEFIKNFTSDIENAYEENLDVCYRLTRLNHKAAICVLEKIDRKGKEIKKYEKGDGDKVKIISSYSQKNEADNIIEIIKNRKNNESINDFLILVPKITFARDIMSKLKDEKIEYISKQRISNYKINKIKKIEEWINNKTNSFLLRELIELIIKKYYPENNEEIYKKISLLWSEIRANKSLFKVLEEKSASDQEIKKVYDTLKNLIDAYDNNDAKYYELIFDNFNIYKNVGEFNKEVSQILDDVNYFYNYKGKDKVRIMTINGAKGLNAEDVFILGLEEGVFPREGFNLEEEQRLFYVALTRAKKKNYLCSSKYRSEKSTFMKFDETGLEKSKFIDLIDNDYIN